MCGTLNGVAVVCISVVWGFLSLVVTSFPFVVVVGLPLVVADVVGIPLSLKYR